LGALPASTVAAAPGGGRFGRPVAQDFVPGPAVLAPSKAKAHVGVNLAALAVLTRLEAEGRPATPPEQDRRPRQLSVRRHGGSPVT